MGNGKFYDRCPLNVNSNSDGVHVNQNWNPENVNDNLGAAVEAVSKLGREHLSKVLFCRFGGSFLLREPAIAISGGGW